MVVIMECLSLCCHGDTCMAFLSAATAWQLLPVAVATTGGRGTGEHTMTVGVAWPPSTAPLTMQLNCATHCPANSHTQHHAPHHTLTSPSLSSFTTPSPPLPPPPPTPSLSPQSLLTQYLSLSILLPLQLFCSRLAPRAPRHVGGAAGTRTVGWAGLLLVRTCALLEYSRNAECSSGSC